MPILPKHIVISRVDNIGDVVLTLALATALKQTWPAVRITVLARDYVREVVALSTAVDNFMSSDTWLQLPTTDALAQLRSLQADVIIHALPRRRIAWLAWRAGIPHRIGTARRWYHRWLCNHRPTFSRAQSSCHEAELNFRLLAPLGLETQPDNHQLKTWLQLRSPQRPKELPFHPGKFNLILHPFSNGNTREWPLDNFADLIAQLPPDRFNCLVTGSAAEHHKLSPLRQRFPHLVDLSGQLSLAELAAHLAHADGVVANSTGPLHLAAALGTRCLGLFPLERTMGPQRWQPLGALAETLTAAEVLCSATPCQNNDCRCIRAISVNAVLQRLLAWERTHG